MDVPVEQAVKVLPTHSNYRQRAAAGVAKWESRLIDNEPPVPLLEKKLVESLLKHVRAAIKPLDRTTYLSYSVAIPNSLCAIAKPHI